MGSNQSKEKSILEKVKVSPQTVKFRPSYTAVQTIGVYVTNESNKRVEYTTQIKGEPELRVWPPFGQVSPSMAFLMAVQLDLSDKVDAPTGEMSVHMLFKVVKDPAKKKHDEKKEVVREIVINIDCRVDEEELKLREKEKQEIELVLSQVEEKQAEKKKPNIIDRVAAFFAKEDKKVPLTTTGKAIEKEKTENK